MTAPITPITCLAFGMPGWTEMMVLLVIGLILFGRRLPEVGRSIGKAFVQFRRGLDDFKREINTDESLRDARDAVDDLRRAVTTPQRYRDPKRVFEALTDESLSSAAPPEPAEPFDAGDTARAADTAGAAPDGEASDTIDPVGDRPTSDQEPADTIEDRKPGDPGHSTGSE